MSEPTMNQVMEAVTLLRKDTEAGTLNPEVKTRIEAVLDVHEAMSEKITAADMEVKKATTELILVKEELEEKGKSIGEINETLETLERELAKKGAAAADPEFAYRETDQYKALHEFCLHGDNADQESKVLLRTDAAVDGGVLVMGEMETFITKKITEIDGIRSIARIRTIGGKNIELPIRNTIPVANYEGEAEEGADSASTYENETVTPFRQTFTTPITQDMLQDANFNMEAEIAGDAGEAFAFGEGNGFVLGTGFKVPEGFVQHATLQTNATVTGDADEITGNGVLLITGDLPTGYNPSYVLNRRSLAKIRTLQASNGHYIWAPGMNGPVANTMAGFPYTLANSMPDEGNNTFPVAFGDFMRGYVIVDRTGMSLIRDNTTLKKKAIIEFTMNRWNTGRVILTEAIKLLKTVT
jgi:HK97 family phage major capsid protein